MLRDNYILLMLAVLAWITGGLTYGIGEWYGQDYTSCYMICNTIGQSIVGFVIVRIGMRNVARLILGILVLSFALNDLADEIFWDPVKLNWSEVLFGGLAMFITLILLYVLCWKKKNS